MVALVQSQIVFNSTNNRMLSTCNTVASPVRSLCPVPWVTVILRFHCNYVHLYAADVDWVEILDHLPPLVSFQLDGVRDRTYCGWSESRLKLPSLCTQVAASLKMLSLTSWTLTSSDLQYIGAHLPLLEVLQFRCVLYIAFKILTILQ